MSKKEELEVILNKELPLKEKDIFTLKSYLIDRIIHSDHPEEFDEKVINKLGQAYKFRRKESEL